jgi:hypothetical protein
MNGLQFASLVIASAVIYWYATTDKRKNTMTAWPENKNPILTIAKEQYDGGDMWGSNLMFLFALCDIATVFDVAIPAELDFSQSPFGADTEDDSYKSILGLMSRDMYIYEPLTLEEFRKHVGHALKVLGKYDSVLRLAGHNY